MVNLSGVLSVFDDFIQHFGVSISAIAKTLGDYLSDGSRRALAEEAISHLKLYRIEKTATQNPLGLSYYQGIVHINYYDCFTNQRLVETSFYKRNVLDERYTQGTYRFCFEDLTQRHSIPIDQAICNSPVEEVIQGIVSREMEDRGYLCYSIHPDNIAVLTKSLGYYQEQIRNNCQVFLDGDDELMISFLLAPDQFWETMPFRELDEYIEGITENDNLRQAFQNMRQMLNEDDLRVQARRWRDNAN